MKLTDEIKQLNELNKKRTQGNFEHGFIEDMETVGKQLDFYADMIHQTNKHFGDSVITTIRGVFASRQEDGANVAVGFTGHTPNSANNAAFLSQAPRMMEIINQLQRDNEKLRAVLEFYADNFNYPFRYPVESCLDNVILNDGGLKAKQALQEGK